MKRKIICISLCLVIAYSVTVLSSLSPPAPAPPKTYVTPGAKVFEWGSYSSTVSTDTLIISGDTTYQHYYDWEPVGAAVDDTSAAFGLRDYDGSHFTYLDFVYKIVGATPGSADTLSGVIVLQLKNLSLNGDTLRQTLDTLIWANAVGPYTWVDYDSGTVLNDAVRDSVTIFDSTGANHMVLPPSDSGRFIWRSSSEADSVAYWYVYARTYGNSEDICQARGGVIQKTGDRAAAADDTLKGMIAYNPCEDGVYNWLTGWIYKFTDTLATADDIEGFYQFRPRMLAGEYAVLDTMVQDTDSSLFYRYAPDASGIYGPLWGNFNDYNISYGATTDYYIKPFAIPINPLIYDYQIGDGTAAGHDSVWYHEVQWQFVR